MLKPDETIIFFIIVIVIVILKDKLSINFIMCVCTHVNHLKSRWGILSIKFYVTYDNDMFIILTGIYTL